eukprot:241527-Rhodomonas_salina.2
METCTSQHRPRDAAPAEITTRPRGGGRPMGIVAGLVTWSGPLAVSQVDYFGFGPKVPNLKDPTIGGNGAGGRCNVAA